MKIINFKLIFYLFILAFSNSVFAEYRIQFKETKQHIDIPKKLISDYPFDDINESNLGLSKNTSWGTPTFLGFGEYDGHKTVKFRFTGSFQGFFVDFGEVKRIKNISIRRTNPGNTSWGHIDVFPSNDKDLVYNTNHLPTIKPESLAQYGRG